MDKELYNKTLTDLCNNPELSKYVELFKNLQFDENRLVYGKYLFVQPPIPGIGMSDYETARNRFSMEYNQRYNEKYNINPYANSWSESDESSEDK